MGKRSGYTLIEILVASLIFVSVIGIGVATYSATSGSQSKSALIRETNQAARFAMDNIVREIREADGYMIYTGTTPAEGSDSSVAGPTQDYGGTKALKVYGYALEDNNGKLNLNAAPAPSKLAIFKRGEGLCSGVTEKKVYSVVDGKLVVSRSYFYNFLYNRSGDAYDGKELSKFVSSGSPYPISSFQSDMSTSDWTYVDKVLTDSTYEACRKSNSNERVMPDTVELVSKGSSSGYWFEISGTNNYISTDLTTYPSVPAKIDLRLKVQPINMGSKAEETRIVDLKTTVTPRFKP